MSFYFSEFRQLKREVAAKAAQRDARLKKKKELVDLNGYSKIKEFDFPEVSKRDLKIINADIRKKIRNQKNKNLLFLIILLVPALLFIFNSIDYSVQNEIIVQSPNENNYLSNNINAYSFLIDDGDKWIEKGHWSNAIYRYKDAVKLFPEKNEAKYRLALAYSYNCKYNSKDCETGTRLTDQLLKYQPNEIDFIELKTAFKDYTKKQTTINNKTSTK